MAEKINESPEDGECFHRSVLLEVRYYEVETTSETIRLSSQAFDDVHLEPSVFRKSLCDNAPWSNPPRLNPTDMIGELTASQIRGIEETKGIEGNALFQSYIADVFPDQSNGQHIAHYVVRTKPMLGKSDKKVFRRLRHSLAAKAKLITFLPPDFEAEIRALPTGRIS
jgi:hypothetical protein